MFVCVRVFLLVIVVEGRVFSWGRADYGQLGVAETADVQRAATSRPANFVPTPSEIVGLGRICQVWMMWPNASQYQSVVLYLL